MDELEFRRRLYADPFDKDVHEMAKNNPDLQAQLDDFLSFEAAMKEAMDIPVPEGLADRIIAKAQEAQTSESMTPEAPHKPVTWYRRHAGPFAMAASIFVATTVYFLSATPTAVHANEYAFEHVYHEMGAFKLTEAVSLQKVNEKLATFGAKLDDLPGKVTYATFCNYRGKKSLHMIYQSEDGPVTVFVVPREDSFRESGRSFVDDRFSGLINPMEKADVILVANLNTPIQQFATDFTSQMEWL